MKTQTLHLPHRADLCLHRDDGLAHGVGGARGQRVLVLEVLSVSGLRVAGVISSYQVTPWPHILISSYIMASSPHILISHITSHRDASCRHIVVTSSITRLDHSLGTSCRCRSPAPWRPAPSRCRGCPGPRRGSAPAPTCANQR